MTNTPPLLRALAIVPTLFDWCYHAEWQANSNTRWLSTFLRWRLVSKSFGELAGSNVTSLSPVCRAFLTAYPTFEEIRRRDYIHYKKWVREMSLQTTKPYVKLSWFTCDHYAALTLEQLKVEHARWTISALRPYQDVTLMKRPPDLSPRDFMSVIVRYYDITYGHSYWAITISDGKGLCGGCVAAMFRTNVIGGPRSLCTQCAKYEISLLAKGPGYLPRPEHCDPRNPEQWMTAEDRKRWNTEIEDALVPHGPRRKKCKLAICVDPSGAIGELL